MINEKLDTYLDLCTEVYDLSKPTPPEDAYVFYRSYAENAKGLILEPMCGTGRFLLPLMADGFAVHGFDASDHMLEKLHEKAMRSHLKPNVWKGFIEDLSKPKPYDLIFIPSGSFGLLTDRNTIKLALKTIYDHLTEDGIFLFEGDTFKSVPSIGLWRGSKWRRDDGKIILLSQCATMEDSICSSICKYELIDENKIVHTEIEELKVKLYKEEEIIGLLKQVGFSRIRAIKAFNKNQKPEECDESIVYECYK